MFKMKQKLFILLFFLIHINFLFADNKTANISDYETIKTRNLFVPIWKPEKLENNTNDKQNDDLLALRKQQEEERLLKLEQEKEKRDLENKKNAIEQGYKLSGILYDGGVLQAIVVDNKNTTY